MLNGNISSVGILRIDACIETQVFYIKARHGISGHKLGHRHMGGIFRQMVYLEFQMGQHIQMAYIEIATVGIASILSRQMIVD